MLMLKHLAIQ
jgi:hypothetical protein